MMKYTKELLQDAVDNTVSYRGILRYLELKQAGGTQAHIKKRIFSYGIDVSHFTGKAHAKGKTSKRRKSADEVLVHNPLRETREKRIVLKRSMIEVGIEYKCSDCGITDTWNDKPIIIEVEHIDGDWTNNLKDNLTFLCPNCHSQTPTYKNKKRI